MTAIKAPRGFWLVHARKARTYHLMPAMTDLQPMCGAKLSLRQSGDGWKLSPPVTGYEAAKIKICPSCESLAAEQAKAST